MNRKICLILLIFTPLTLFAQEEYIQVNTKCDTTKKGKELVVEIVNKSDREMVVANLRIGGFELSFLKIHFMDENDQRLDMLLDTFPFINGVEPPRYLLRIDPNSIEVFKYPYDSLSRYCKQPDRIKKMQIEYYIVYSIWDNESLIAEGTYDQFSKIILLQL